LPTVARSIVEADGRAARDDASKGSAIGEGAQAMLATVEEAVDKEPKGEDVVARCVTGGGWIPSQVMVRCS
jgi:hypothetical protein